MGVENGRSDTRLASAEERRQLEAWNATERSYPLDTPLHHFIERQVERTPDVIAVSFEGETLTYRELDRRANQVAHHLVGLGVRPDGMVAICIDRSLAMVVGLLGILKSGGAYVPLDPDYPKERLDFMVADCAAPVLLTSSALRGRIDASGAAVVALDTDGSLIARAPSDAPPAVQLAPKNLAYTIYTSGSTGRPKGAMNTHEGIVNRLLWMQETYVLTPRDRVLQKTPFSFDVSVWEFFWPLMTGARLVLARPGGHKDPAYLVHLIMKEGITTLHFVPSMLSLFNVADGLEQITSLRQVFCSGEALPREQVRRFFRRTMGTRLHNLYGPTEAAVDVSSWECPRDGEGEVVPIGRPVANTILRILDPSLRPVAIGEAGELHIGGVQLARGYLNRPELTREKFIADPLGAAGDRLYKTGDLARHLPDGNIEYLGRIDFQVKIRGFRIELGEVEAALLKHPSVKEAVVVATEDRLADKRLVAYLVATPGKRPTTNALREKLLAELPDYMVPALFVFVPRMPLTPNGKVDRGGFGKGPLPRPDLEQVFVAPKRPTEKTIAALWCEILGLEKVGVRDNFFDLGGNSLLALEMVRALSERDGFHVSLVKLFQYPSIKGLADFLEAKDPESASLDRIVERASRQRGAASTNHDGVAIIGMSGRFPGAYDPDELWTNLCNGVESITFFSKDELGPGLDPEITNHPNYVFARGIIPDGDKFDAEFFGINPAEARLMDPQQRVFLELAWKALENAGYAPEATSDLIGVYAGMGNNYYFALNASTQTDLLRMVGPFPVMIGNEKDHIATRVAHKLNLTGPAVSVHTACSTALTAIDNAFFSLVTHQCDLALAGGISLQTPQYSGQLAEDGGVFARDGHCRPFDAAADGTMFSDSAGIVVLKRLDEAIRDRDTIYAVLKSTALNNDGSDKVSYLAPSVNGQKRVVAMALSRAGVSADSIGYIEAHGTATPIGDPIEIEALTQVFRRDTDRNQFCGIGSVKSNLGHPTIAAGVVGVMKVALALKHEKIPATIHYEKPNPKIDFANSPFYVVSHLTPWPRGAEVRRAGVSSFGFGGTNAHAILEEAPLPSPHAPSRARQLLVLSAKSREALERVSANLASHLEQHPEAPLADVAFTLEVGRTHQNHRRFVVCGDTQTAAALLRAPTREACGARLVEGGAPEIVFLFPGQGSQYVNMGRALYLAEPVFQESIDRCAAILLPLVGWDLRDVLYPAVTDEAAAARLKDTRFQQPAVFAVEYALSRLWASWGIVPDALIGHSIGEFVAATLASVFTLEDALSLVATRGRMMSELPNGAMLAVRLPAAEVAKRLPERVSLAASNAPSMCVVAGEADAVETLRLTLEKEDVFCRLLETSHAFHSAMMDPIVGPFAAEVARATRAEPKIPILSTLTARWVTPGEMADPSYWSRHLRSPVLFSEAIARVLEDPDRVLLEVGPGTQTSALARAQTTLARAPAPIATLGRNSDAETEWTGILAALGELWLAGVVVDWSRFRANEARGRIPLPTYPFARTRHWVDPAADAVRPSKGRAKPVAEALPVTPPSSPGAPSESSRERLVRTLTEILATISGAEAGEGFDPARTFAEMGLDSLFLTQISYMVNREHGVKVTFRQLTGEANSLLLLADLIEREAGGPRTPQPATVPDRALDPDYDADSFPANDFQREVMDLVRTFGSEASCAFNESLSIGLDGPGFDRSAMEEALRKLVARHDALRSTFARDGHTLRISSALPFTIAHHDWSDTSSADAALADALKRDFEVPFDLHAGPVVRAGIHALGPERHVVTITSHLTVCDMWSLDVLVRDLGVLYSAALAGTPDALPPADSYREYSLAMRARASTAPSRAMGAYWRRRLETPVPPADLPLAPGRPRRRTFRGARVDMTLPSETVRSLARLAAEAGCSLYTVLLAGLELLLATRGEGRSTVVVGMPAAGQAMSHRTHLVGSCLHYLPLVRTLSLSQPLFELLKDVQNDVVEAMENGEYPVGEIARALPRPSDPSRVPFLQVCLNASPTMDARELRYSGLTARPSVNPRSFESFELFINALIDKGDRVELQFQYNADLFRAEDVRGLQEALGALYAKLGASPRGELAAYAQVEGARRATADAPDGSKKPGVHPGFFGPNEALYGVLSIPKTGRSPVGVVLCPPIGQEYMRSFWAIRQLANQLTTAGLPTLKFDYLGTGDSLGDGSDWDLEAWGANVSAACDRLKSEGGVREVSLVTLRFGAIAASRALERGLRVRDLVLWDPVVSGGAYLADLRRIQDGLVTDQTEGFPFPSASELDVDPAELAGFRYPPDLRAAMASSTLIDRSFDGAERITLCLSQERAEYRALERSLRARGHSPDVRVIPDDGGWDDPARWEAGLLPNRILETLPGLLRKGDA